MENNENYEEYTSWSTENLYNYLVDLGVIDGDTEPYKYWKHQREDLIRFMMDVDMYYERAIR